MDLRWDQLPMAGHPALSPSIWMPVGSNQPQPAGPRPILGRRGSAGFSNPQMGTQLLHCLLQLPDLSAEKGLRWTCGHTETPCLSGHCYHLSESGQYHKQISEAKGVRFAPAQLPGLISIPGQQLTSIGPAIYCQRWCSQIPTIQERLVIIPQIQVRGDSHFCARFSLSMPSFVSSLSSSPLLFSKVVMSFPPFNHFLNFFFSP